MIRFIGDEIELDIKGDGLLKHVLDVGAQLADIEFGENNHDSA